MNSPDPARALARKVEMYEKQIKSLYALSALCPESRAHFDWLKKEAASLYLELSAKLPLRYVCLRPASSNRARVYGRGGAFSAYPPGKGYDMYVAKGNDIEGPVWLLAAVCQVESPIASTVEGDGLIDLSADFVNFAINKKFALYERPDHRTD